MSSILPPGRPLPRGLKALVVAAALALPTSAAACPYCAQRDDPNSLRTWAVVGSMIFFPFALGAGAIAAIRKMDKSEKEVEQR